MVRGVGPSGEQTRAFSRRRDLPRHVPSLAWLIALAIAAAFLVVFLLELPRNITELAWDSDYASGFTIPETLVRTGSGGSTVISSSGQWVPLWFGLLTARLPLHRELWGVAPTLLFLLTALTVGWSVAQLAGRSAAVFAVLLSLVASSRALAFLMAAVAHNTVYPCTALLGAYLIWLARGEGRGRVMSLLVPPMAGIAVGACLASDLLLAATALIPLGLTAILAGLRRERRSRLVACSSLATVAVAIPTAALTTSVMNQLGYRTLPTPVKIAPLAELPARAQLLFKGLKDLFNGYLEDPDASGFLHTPLGIACTVVMSLALLAMLAVGLRVTISFISSGLREKDKKRTPIELARSLHIIYWSSAAATAGGAFWLAAEGPGVTHESYYGTVIFAVAAVIPLLLSRRPLMRWLVPVGAAIFFAGSLVGLTSNYMNEWAIPDISPVTQIARMYHVRYGFSGYSQSSNLTWNTDGRVVVRPVMLCRNPGGVDICPFLLARVPSWYAPQKRRSFLLIDRAEGWLYALPRGLGRPLAAYAFGTFQMYIYPYDIASRFGPLPA